MNTPIQKTERQSIVQKFNLHNIYVLGQRLSKLDGIAPETKLSDIALNIHWAQSSLEEMVSNTSPLLDTSKRAANSLLESINVISPKGKNIFSDEFKEKTVGRHCYAILSAKHALESVLGNDMPGISAYLVSQKGIYRTEDLISHADQYFPSGIRESIPEQATKDLIEAGKCLAYEVSTACSFHLWRSVETVMAAYYKKLAGKEFSDDGVTRNWAAYIKALNAKGADAKITQFLDHIRQEYRNPQTHPEAMLEANDALALFGVAMSAINQMVSAIQKLP